MILKKITFVLLLWGAFAFSLPVFSQDNVYEVKTLVIDPGHGGKDPGAMSKYGKEKDIVLKIAKYLKKYINDSLPDVKVILTRDKDVFVELYKRGEIANKNNADLFISIHINSNESSRPYGTETYVMGLHKTKQNLEVAKKENQVILKEIDYEKRYDGFDPNSPEASIIFTLFQNAYLDQSLKLASFVQDNFKNTAHRTDRGVKQAGFLVLWKTAMPSILIEAGFLSNPEEAKYLVSDKGQKELAYAIYKAFKQYKEAVEAEGRAMKEAEDSEKYPVTYKVQFLTSSKIVDYGNREFSGLDASQISTEKVKQGLYKYYYGKEHTYKDIVPLYKKVKKNFKDAFIVAFDKDGKRISLREAKKSERK